MKPQPPILMNRPRCPTPLPALTWALLLTACESQPDPEAVARGYSFYTWPRGWTDTDDDGLPDTFVAHDDNGARR